MSLEQIVLVYGCLLIFDVVVMGIIMMLGRDGQGDIGGLVRMYAAPLLMYFTLASFFAIPVAVLIWNHTQFV